MIITGEWDDEHWYGDVRVDGRVLSPKRSQKIRNHSPDGFAWGYGGSGPAQLALAILLKAGLSPERAVDLYQQFKVQYISNLPRGAFMLDVDVLDWVRRQK